jgi:ribonuclease HI
MIYQLPPKGKEFLLLLLNRSWTTNTIPAPWRVSNIIPIAKIGKPPSLASSYRPIALTSCLAKLLERLVSNRLQHWLESEIKLNPNQAGFRRCRSTEEQVALVVQLAMDGFQQKERTLMVAVDLSKAYDKLWKDALLAKLGRLGVPSCYCRWINTFLRDRSAHVTWGSSISRRRLFPEGLPQGSVLAPLLWTVFINDITEPIHWAVKTPMFADDLTLVTTSTNLQRCQRQMQPALDLLASWARNWKQTISAEKTVASFFSLDPKEVGGKVSLRIKLDDAPIRIDPALKILGVWLDPQLNFARQCTEVAKRMQVRNNILRSLSGRAWGTQCGALRTLYMSYCQSLATYCASSWLSMTCESNREKLEVQHRRGARTITGCTSTSPNNAVLREAGLLPLSCKATESATLLREKLLRLPKTLPSHKVAARHQSTRIKAHGCNGAHRQSWRDIARATARKTRLEEFPREQLLLTSVAPWAPQQSVRIISEIDNMPGRTQPPELRAAAAIKALNLLPVPDIKIWTDGSAIGGTTDGGAGVYAELPDDRVMTKTASAGKFTSSFRAEMVALRTALAMLETEIDVTGSNFVMILSDSQSLLKCLAKGPSAQTHKLASEIWAVLQELSIDAPFVLHWVPSHCNLTGNEEADAVAKEATKLDHANQALDQPTARAHVKRFCRMEVDAIYKADSHTEHHRRTTGGVYIPSDSSLPRGLQVSISQLRVGHAPMSRHYLHRIGKADSPNCLQCGQSDTIEHLLLRCPNTRRARRAHLGPRPTMAVLGSRPADVANFLQEIGAVTRPPD